MNTLLKALSYLAFASTAIAQEPASNSSDISSINTVEFWWTLSWITANPDGMKERLVVAVNGSYPLPVVSVPKNSRVIVHVNNQVAGNATSFHWHGMFLNGTEVLVNNNLWIENGDADSSESTNSTAAFDSDYPWWVADESNEEDVMRTMHTGNDGPPQLNQCVIPYNHTMTYDFIVNQTGTYWYHAHVENLYPDGQRQMFLVTDDDPPFDYDEELAISMSDWYHDLYDNIKSADFMTLYNPTGAEPVPQSILTNDTWQDLKIQLKPNTTYRLRIASTSLFSAFFWYIEGQNVTIVEVDGVYTEPAEAQVIEMGVSQRYSVLFTTPDDDNAVYRLVQIADQSLYDVVPPDLQLNVTAWFYTGDEDGKTFDTITHEEIYNGIPLKPAPGEDDVADVDDFTSDNIASFDDTTLVPADGMALLPEPDVETTLNLTLTNLLDGVNYAFFNDISYTKPSVPSLYTVLSAPDDDTASNETIYGSNTHPVILEHNQVHQLILNNDDTGKHPFHLHGHNFQVLLRPDSIGDGQDEEDFNPYDPDNHDDFPATPIRRDTLIVRPMSHFVIRWRADNPGTWIFHCHIEWHLTQGLAMEFIEAPLQIRQNFKIPKSHIDVCKAADVAYIGNAAANVADFSDLDGEPLQVKDLPSGFTARGIVALVFSCICALLGCAVLTWYGLTDQPRGEARLVARAIEDAKVEKS